MKRTVLFYRNFDKFSGGHLKVWHYFCHIRSAPVHAPEIYFTPDTIWDHTNPWMSVPSCIVDDWSPSAADILFIEGRDWRVIDKDQRRDSSKPIINLIQSTRHGDPQNKRYRYLKYKAVRICVCQPVADAIAQANQVNGPVYTVPAGLDIEPLAEAASAKGRDIDILIVGLKQPDLARSLYHHLADLQCSVELIDTLISRSRFLDRLGRTRLSVHLPMAREGCYLPALEAMALGTMVVCPDCSGNLGYCKDGGNCFVPAYREQEIVASVHKALAVAPDHAARILANGVATARCHSLARERAEFLDILTNLDQIW